MEKRTGARRRMLERFEEAERKGRCLAVRSDADREWLRRHVLSGGVVRPMRGLYARTAYWGGLAKDERSLHIVRALALLHPHWRFCGYSALLVHGIPVSHACLDRIHICARHDAPQRGQGVICRDYVDSSHGESVDGIQVTPCVQAMVDSLRDAPFPEGLAIADAVARKYCFEREFIRDLVVSLGRGRRGIANALKAARYVDMRSENGGESVARAILIEAGLAPTDLQVEFRDPTDPDTVYRVDYLWELVDGTKVIGELDGKGKYRDPTVRGDKSIDDVLVAERQRESHLTMLGMPVIRFAMKDVRTPGRLAHLLKAAGVTAETLVDHDFRETSPGLPPGFSSCGPRRLRGDSSH